MSTSSALLAALLLATASWTRADDGGYLADLRHMYHVYQECAAEEGVAACLKLKLVAAMDRGARSLAPRVPLFAGITLVREESNAVLPPPAEPDLAATLPRALAAREAALDALIFSRVGAFLDGHALQVQLPSGDEVARAFSGGGESRGKRKRMHGMLLIPLILGGTLVPLALGALALLAGKAMIVSKLALVLAAVIGIKKLLGGGGGSGGQESNHEVVVAGGHGGGWGRTYVDPAHQLAYAAYAPPTTAT